MTLGCNQWRSWPVANLPWYVAVFATVDDLSVGIGWEHQADALHHTEPDCCNCDPKQHICEELAWCLWSVHSGGLLSFTNGDSASCTSRRSSDSGQGMNSTMCNLRSYSSIHP